MTNKSTEPMNCPECKMPPSSGERDFLCGSYFHDGGLRCSSQCEAISHVWRLGMEYRSLNRGYDDLASKLAQAEKEIKRLREIIKSNQNGN